MSTAVPKEATEAPVIVDDGQHKGFDDGLAWVKYEFRDVTYKISELPIGEFDEITKKATRTEKKVDEDTGETSSVETFDRNLQSRLMLRACIVEPGKVDISKMGTRLVVALNSIINELHYGEEPDGLEAAKAAKKKADKADDEGKSGNG